MSTELVQVLQEFNLEESKKNVVNGLLQPFFAKAEEWKTQVDTIVITDPTQTDKMALAKTGRLQLRNFRLEAEKLVKSQRETIKARMADDVLEDKLWLRSGQIMEAVFKNLETKLEEKEKFAERYQAELEEKLRAERTQILAEYGQPEIPGLGKMLQDQFDMYIAGVKAKFEADKKAEEERIEAQRIQDLHNERYSRLAKYADFIPGFEEIHFGVITDESYIQYGTEAKEKKEAHDAEQARIKAENERLQKEKDEADKRMEVRSNELKPYIVFIRDYNALIKSDEADYQKQFADIKKGAEDHWEYERQQEAKASAKTEERGRSALRFLLDNGFEQVDGGVRYKLDSSNWFIGNNIYSLLSSDKEYDEFKKSVLNQIDLINLEAEKQKAIDEANRLKEAEQKRMQDELKAEKDRIAEQQRIASQGETERLLQWVESFELSEPVGNYSPEARGNILAILSRFNGFKKWAKDTITTK